MNRKKITQNKYAAYAASRSTNSLKSTKKSQKNDGRVGNQTICPITTPKQIRLEGEKNSNANYNIEMLKSNDNKILITAPDSINDLR